MSEKTKKPQPPALRLANAARRLRRTARDLVNALERHHSGNANYTIAYVEACEEEHEQAALKFAKAAYDCNGSYWDDLII